MKNQYKKIRILSLCSLIAISSLLFNISLYHSASALRSITFPVIGDSHYSDDFYSPRQGGIHGATDIIASKMQKIVSPVNGTLTYIAYPEPSYGYMISIRDSDNYRYNFIHINNDTPGTDDGHGYEMNAYAADMKQGNPVVKGQHLGYVGDSGNAEDTVSHLHFEIIKPNGDPENPYPSLVRAPHISKPAMYPALSVEILPFEATFSGDLNISMGNFEGDIQSEIVTAPNREGGPRVRVFSNSTRIGDFFAYDSSFRGGVDVAAGDVDGDGIDEIITGAGPGGGPHVKAFRLDGTEIASFMAFDSSYRDGLRVAAGDVDGDGIDEIIVGTGRGSGPYVQTFEPDGTRVSSFLAYDPSNRDGIDVAADNVSGSLNSEIITIPGAGSGPKVVIFNTDGTIASSFFAYDSSFRGGMKISAGNVATGTPYAEIATVPAIKGKAVVALFGATGTFINSTTFLEPWWRGYYDVAAGYDTSKAATGFSRRASIRPGVD